MGFLDSLLGRSRPKAPDLDALFQVPSAALSLSAALALEPTGQGAVCYRAASGAAFEDLRAEVVALLGADGSPPRVETRPDSFGYTWTLLTQETSTESGPDLSALCTGLHVVNTSLESQGFASGLLCTIVPFAALDGSRVALVYLYKQGTFYPFAPAPGASARDPRRNALLEMQVRDVLATELPLEKDLQRAMALWDAPGL